MLKREHNFQTLFFVHFQHSFLNLLSLLFVLLTKFIPALVLASGLDYQGFCLSVEVEEREEWRKMLMDIGRI